ncbi:Bardet-Biedl syndrome 5 protein homolog [Macrosteles quadrilineatus]|uniref:Bardet-Biedl syndrome 5 protein homolog n=1 Tax=Macrosteles quadrilineatus TaxID=74068 RepID=UPI0023E2B7D3|nr:Bardet-Biedl syndrome 5 protein homolog [Macrosteles quadrilineatus]
MELWEDREIRFDVPIAQMKMRSGEKVIDRLDFVEDTKGNGGDKGRLIVTNLRILWHSLTVARISLSIGFNCMLSITTKVVNSKLRGTTEALYILTKYGSSRFEFIFTNLVAGNTRHFTSVMGVHKAYQSSRIYRDMKLRGAVVRDKQLRILPLESIYTTVDGIWNLSSDQGNVGSFIITNIRLVWYAEMNENFNVSLPYICIATIRVRESKFGPALVVESCGVNGGYVLGFRIDPPAKLQSVTRELISLYNIHSQQPEFGVQYSLSVQTPLAEEAAVVAEEVQEVDESAAELSTSLATYCSEGVDKEDVAPVYNSQLGLAIEPLRPGYTLADLWQITPPPPHNPHTPV